MKYNSIGKQLIAKAKELDPSYKPDKFNDMSEAINIILNNSSSGGGSDGGKLNGLVVYVNENYNEQTKAFTGTLTDEQYAKIKNGQIYYIEVVYKLGGDPDSNSSAIFNYVAPIFAGYMFIGPAGAYMFVGYKTVEGTLKDSLLMLTTDDTPRSQLIPSITTNNEQQNLTVGDGLIISDGQLKSTLSNFKYGCMKLNNIKVGENKYSLHIYLLDYMYDAIINRASEIFNTVLTRDTFPGFVKTNMTHELFIQLITGIVEMNQLVCTMPYLSFDIEQTLPTESYMHNCSLIKEGIIGFVCGTNNIVFDNPTFEDDFSLVYNNSFYGD